MCLLTPSSRPTSPAVRPASTSFNTSMICASLRFRIDIASPFSPSEIIFLFCGFRGAGHTGIDPDRLTPSETARSLTQEIRTFSPIPMRLDDGTGGSSSTGHNHTLCQNAYLIIACRCGDRWVPIGTRLTNLDHQIQKRRLDILIPVGSILGNDNHFAFTEEILGASLD